MKLEQTNYRLFWNPKNVIDTSFELHSRKLNLVDEIVTPMTLDQSRRLSHGN